MFNKINETSAHRQWFSRPDDQKFYSPAELRAYLERRTNESSEQTVMPADLVVMPHDGDLVVQYPYQKTPESAPVLREASLSNWSAGQLARIASNSLRSTMFDLVGDTEAPYQDDALRIVADIFNLGLARREHRITESLKDENREGVRGRKPTMGISLYSHQDAAGSLMIRSANSEVYTRYYDLAALDFLSAHAIPAGFEQPLMNRPGVFGMPDVTKGARPGGLFASDRDMFVILINKANPVEVRGDLLYRGIIVRHSEVGAGTLAFDAFHLRGICGNLIMSGLENILSVRIRHMGELDGKIQKAFDQDLATYLTRDTQAESALISAAMDHQVASNDEEAVEYLVDEGFTQKVAESSVEAAVKEEGRAGSRWDLVNGVTAHARSIPHMDQRNLLERKAGQLLIAA